MDNKEELSKEILARQFLYKEEVRYRYTEDNYSKYLSDITNHLIYLASSINMDSFELFNDYILWTKGLEQDLNIIAEHAPVNLNCIKALLCLQSPKEMGIFINKFIDDTINNHLSPIEASKTLDHNGYINIFSEYLKLTLNMEQIKASKLIMDEVEKGTSIKELYVYVFEPSLRRIGILWNRKRITIAQEHYFTATTQLIMAQLYSRIFQSNKNGLKFISVCVDGELHEVGIRMVSDMLELDGWDTYYLGANISKLELMNILVKMKAQVLGISVTMTYNLQKVRDLICEIRSIDKLKNMKILVGGYPFNIDKNLWKKIDADLYAPNAIETCNLLTNNFKGEYLI